MHLPSFLTGFILFWKIDRRSITDIFRPSRTIQNLQSSHKNTQKICLGLVWVTLVQVSPTRLALGISQFRKESGQDLPGASAPPISFSNELHQVCAGKRFPQDRESGSPSRWGVLFPQVMDLSSLAHKLLQTLRWWFRNKPPDCFKMGQGCCNKFLWWSW